MSSVASCAQLAGGRWHFQHGPIDLIMGAEGEAGMIENAVECAWERFQGVLPELVTELRTLRMPVEQGGQLFGTIACRMASACAPFAPLFITPMAAVAGAVADEMIEFFRIPGIAKAYVNNGGDIALHLTPSTSFRVGMCAGGDRKPTALDGAFEVRAETSVRGIATSGWHGRSFSLGIADAVTVLAETAAKADAAATMIANAVNAESPAVVRRPANSLKDDTDLGARLVTVEVGNLTAEEVAQALENGQRAAQGMMTTGLIAAAVLKLKGAVATVGAAGAARLL
ncbi:MAG: UPF0280 family protein [Betaproteobacteria bacterium]|nr:UPF0280 family protein [Betaproteobacteria bacterium]